MRRKILVGSLILVALLAAGAFALYHAMANAWVRYNEYDIRTEGQLQAGDLAPDLALARVGDEGQVLLSDLYRERPVVLAFGSYT